MPGRKPASTDPLKPLDRLFPPLLKATSRSQ